ncbi:hypothetical protein [Paludibaculum fermentans]|uniref:hypothetical protein n=1 Tax=Paludibaculum fermentans TaxID=1473598 RepID=UPI001E2F1C3C|nr:hypothetical protein [Paludibaculum fermentans]
MPLRLAFRLLAVLAGILLLIGLWTPVVAAVVAVAEAWIGFSLRPLHPGDEWVHFLLAILAGSVAMLGPGAWSMDAHLFGRKRFEINGRSRHK